MHLEKLKEEYEEITRLFSQARFVWQTNKKHFHKTEEQPEVDKRISEINQEIENVAGQITAPNFNPRQLKHLKKMVQTFSEEMKERALLVWKEKSVDEILNEFKQERRNYEEGARKQYSKDVQKILDDRIDKILAIVQKLRNDDIPLSEWKASLKKTKDFIDFFLNNMNQIRNAEFQRIYIKPTTFQKISKKTTVKNDFYRKYQSAEEALSDTQATFELAFQNIFSEESSKEFSLVFSKQWYDSDKSKTSISTVTSSAPPSPTITPRSPSTSKEITPPTRYKP